MIEGRSERATGTPNTIYDLSSVLFHALEGGASYDQFIQDAEEADDQELASFFRRVRDEDGDRASEARRLLAGRTARWAEETAPGVFPRPEPSAAFPGTEPITEETPSRAVDRETAARTPEVDRAPLGDVPPGVSRMEKAPMEEKAAADAPPQASPGTEKDRGLTDKARDYLLGEGRERDYLRGEER